MKKLISILLLVISIVGCRSVPNVPDLNGTWDYKMIDEVSRKEYVGSMALRSEYFEVNGVSNDIFGKCKVSGTVALSKFVLKFIDSNKSVINTINVEMTSRDEFSGTFRSSNNMRGTINGVRRN